MTETKLQASILSALKSAGVWAMRVNSGLAQRGSRTIQLAPRGTPDILCIDPYVWLEVKVPGGIISSDQLRWHEHARLRGVQCEVVTSVKEAIEAVTAAKRAR